MYDLSPKLKYINVSHDIIAWLEISGKLQPSLLIVRLTTSQKLLNLNIINDVENILVLLPYKNIRHV